tara:strand:- start:739 stop:873 length:135 start_codon:yes stop_codon:yes gene_type:complete
MLKPAGLKHCATVCDSNLNLWSLATFEAASWQLHSLLGVGNLDW